MLDSEDGTLIATNNEPIEDGANLYIGSAANRGLFGRVVPAILLFAWCILPPTHTYSRIPASEDSGVFGVTTEMKQSVECW